MPLSLFRRRKKKHEEEQAPPATAAPESKPPEVPTDAAQAPSPPAEGQPTGPKRRRGTRGGKGRSRTGAKTAADGAAATAEEEKKPAERKQPRQRPARRAQQRRAPLPKARRTLLVSVDAGEKRVAVLEDDVVAEVYLERPEHRSIAGNVYLGIVDNVLPGMEAAFVEIGLEKNGFLYVDEIVGPELEGRKGARKIQDLIQKGQTILVQAVKDPMKTKGARLTTEISLPGRFVVFVPYGDGVGVSRRLEEEERNRLKAIVKELAPKQGSVIVRTAAEGASAEDVARDLDFLQRLWKTIEARAKSAKAPTLIYQEAELPLRVTRDLFTGDFEKLLVDHDLAHKRIVGYLKKTSPHMVERVERYRERPPLMEAYGVAHEIQSTLSRRVDLPSGGYLIFDYAEAFTVIDVNTGRFVGSRSKSSPGRLEDTITKNNLEAVKEVVRQLRLRDIGGIIVIDFIDMANPKNRAAVEEALRHELERDRTKTYVVEISPLGLVEMTRQNVTDGPREVMTRRCPTCAGDGIIVSESTTALEIERKLRALVTPGGRAKAFKVELNSKIAALVVGPAASRLRELEETTKRRFFLVGRDDIHLDHFRVLEQGTVEKLVPEAPIETGKELELKLGEVGLHDPAAGVGKLDGLDVVVADAAKLVGKKVGARVTAVMDGVAYAELVDRAAGPEPPITAETEAEKPTRARRNPKKQTEEGDETVVEAAAEEDDADPAEDGAEAAPAKKRTRRGTRGGRNRRKKPATAAAAEGEADASVDAEADAAAEVQEEVNPASVEPEPEPAAEERPPGPVIHVPAPELGREEEADEEDGDAVAAEDGEQTAAPRKRTRRGSRGGRNRRKKPAAAAEAGVATATVAEEAPESGSEEPSDNGSEDARAWEYTPMSEWGGIDEPEE